MILIIVRFVCRSIIIVSISSLVAIQLLLRKKAAEELKKEQERKSAERRRIIEERCGKPKDLENASEGIVENFLVILTFPSIFLLLYTPHLNLLSLITIWLKMMRRRIGKKEQII